MQTREELKATDEELIRIVGADREASAREKEFARRLNRLIWAIHDIEEFVETHPAFTGCYKVFGKPH